MLVVLAANVVSSPFTDASKKFTAPLKRSESGLESPVAAMFTDNLVIWFVRLQ